MGWSPSALIIGSAIRGTITWIYRTLKGAKKHGGLKKHFDHLEQVDEYNKTREDKHNIMLDWDTSDDPKDYWFTDKELKQLNGGKDYETFEYVSFPKSIWWENWRSFWLPSWPFGTIERYTPGEPIVTKNYTGTGPGTWHTINWMPFADTEGIIYHGNKFINWFIGINLLWTIWSFFALVRIFLIGYLINFTCN